MPESEMTYDEMVLEVENMLGHETMAGAFLRVRLAWRELHRALIVELPKWARRRFHDA